MEGVDPTIRGGWDPKLWEMMIENHEMQGDPFPTKPHVRTLTPIRQTAGSLWESYNKDANWVSSFSVILNHLILNSSNDGPDVVGASFTSWTCRPWQAFGTPHPPAGSGSSFVRQQGSARWSWGAMDRIMQCCCALWGLWLWRTDEDGREGSLSQVGDEDLKGLWKCWMLKLQGQTSEAQDF